MRNVITIASIMLALNLVTPSSQAAESFDGLWAQTKKGMPQQGKCGQRDVHRLE